LKKKEDIPINKENFFRHKIDSIFVTASWVEAVKNGTGITGVSQVWDDQPAWYIWIEQAPGPFAFSLEQTDILDVETGGLISGQFSLKCYPFPDNDLFAAFSRAERQAILSDLFDQTNTPAMETKNRIQDNLFVVGALSFVLDSDERICLITFDSLDCFRELKFFDHAPNSPNILIDHGQTFRRVPGWQIGKMFFERFVSLYTFYSKTHPFKLSITEAPGFETICKASGRRKVVPALDLRQKSASVLFKKPDGDPSAANALWRARLEADDRVLAEFDGHQFWQKMDSAGRLAEFPLHHQWWHLADIKATSALSSTCGCDGH
jgi:hypothetical protein